nr:uncharacterized transporter slc-17.2-like [Parasteatoda tepidariorum]
MDIATEIPCKELCEDVSTSGKARREKGSLIPSRYIIVLLGFSTAAVITCQRMNLSMGLVAMVNQSSSIDVGTSNWTECPVPLLLVVDGEHKLHHHGGGHFTWNSETQGLISSISFFGFMISQTPGGRMAELFGARQVLLISILLASLSNILSPVLADFGPFALLGIQFIKGVSQGVQQPAMNCLMANWFPSPEKGILSSVVFSGYPGGCVIGGLICGILCDSGFLGGWPAVFYVFGALGLLLVVAFYYLSPNTPEEDSKISEDELKYILSNLDINNTSEIQVTPWKPMLMSPATWAFFIALFGQYWMMFYLMTGYPIYLSSILHFTHTESGYMNSFPYIGQMLIPYLASYLSTFVVKKGYSSVDFARRLCNSLSCLFFCLGLIGVSVAGCDRTLNTVGFFIAIISVGIGYSGSCIVALDMTANFAGTLFGLAATIASLSGFLIPLIVGALTHQQTLAQWNVVIYISVGVVSVSGIVFHFCGSANLQPWDSLEENAYKDGVENEAYEHDVKYDQFWKVVEDRYISENGHNLPDVLIERL